MQLNAQRVSHNDILAADGFEELSSLQSRIGGIDIVVLGKTNTKTNISHNALPRKDIQTHDNEVQQSSTTSSKVVKAQQRSPMPLTVMKKRGSAQSIICLSVKPELRETFSKWNLLSLREVPCLLIY